MFADALPVLLAATVVGAWVVLRTEHGRIRSTPVVALIGATAGGPAGFAVAWSLGFCVFAPDASGIDRAFGSTLVLGAGLLGSRGIALLLDPDLVRRRRAAGDDVSHGIFRGHPVLPLPLLAPTLAILIVFLYWLALRTVRLSTRLVQLGALRVGDRCVTNFTELMGPSRPGVLAAVTVLAIGVIALAGILERRAGHSSTSPAAVAAARTRAERTGDRLRLLGIAAVLVALWLLWNDRYRGVYTATVVVSVGTVLGGLMIALGLAVLAYRPVRGGSIYRTLLIRPYAISPPIVGLIVYVMFDPNSGVIDHWLGALLGIGLSNYRQSATAALVVVILASISKTLGYNLLFYLAGLQTVPDDQIEAAIIDGAGPWTRFRFIILPALSLITFFLIITNLTYAFFETFGTIDYLTAGGPAGARTVAMYEIYQAAIPGRDLGRGASQSLILFLGVVALTVCQFRSTGRRVSHGR